MADKETRYRTDRETLKSCRLSAGQETRARSWKQDPRIGPCRHESTDMTQHTGPRRQDSTEKTPQTLQTGLNHNRWPRANQKHHHNRRPSLASSQSIFRTSAAFFCLWLFNSVLHQEVKFFFLFQIIFYCQRMKDVIMYLPFCVLVTVAKIFNDPLT